MFLEISDFVLFIKKLYKYQCLKIKKGGRKLCYVFYKGNISKLIFFNFI